MRKRLMTLLLAIAAAFGLLTVAAVPASAATTGNVIVNSCYSERALLVMGTSYGVWKSRSLTVCQSSESFMNNAQKIWIPAYCAVISPWGTRYNGGSAGWWLTISGNYQRLVYKVDC